MTCCNRRSVSFLTLLVGFCCLILIAQAQAQDSTTTVRKARNTQVEYFYVHGALGLGFDVYTSSDIEALVLEDLNVNALGFPFQYGIRGGFRNIVQIEYCKYSTSAHNIGTGGFANGGIVSTSVPMKLKATDILFKMNPAFWKWSKPKGGRPAKCLFLILGNGDVSYRDNVGDGFEGSGIIYGLEWAGISKYVSVSFGATYQDITYDTTRLFSIDIPYEVKAKRFMLYVRMGLGYGV
ncbi:MAG: hypothetical protein PHR28_07095 [candidate division Zixibacteria bacterium]|nr:hypothetical protein [candidate division Zixibacteria bacterium]